MGLVFRYMFDKTTRKQISKFLKDRQVVSGLIDGFVPQIESNEVLKCLTFPHSLSPFTASLITALVYN